MIFAGRTALVTGGTRGIGLATALALGERGADTVLTYAWGSADPEVVYSAFEQRGAPRPLLVQADVGRADDTAALMATLRDHVPGIDVFVSNASMAVLPESLDDYTERGLLQSVSYGAWPLVAYTRALHATFGRWPRYVVAMSSDGPDHYSYRYDFVAASKAVLETLVRYLTWHLRDEDVRVNAVRSRSVRTESFEATFGAGLDDLARRFASERHFVEPEEVAGAVVALASGCMDAVRGQVLVIDRGTAFSDDLLRIFDQRDDLPLWSDR
ncbi:MAG: SDR family oxidoreductase [Alphaproteobacteria bacterium]|nr:SDR family oxidoreductase [Alphaproteobacteria bacterium]